MSDDDLTLLLDAPSGNEGDAQGDGAATTNDGAASAGNDGTDGSAFIPDEELSMMEKRDVRKLPKADIKRWKKLRKLAAAAGSSDDDGSDRDKKDKKKKKKDKKSKKEEKKKGDAKSAGKKKEKEKEKKESKKSKKQRKNELGIAEGADDDEAALAALEKAAAMPLGKVKGGKKGAAAAAAAAEAADPTKRINKKYEVPVAVLKEDTALTIKLMADAAEADVLARKEGRPPLYRLAVREQVLRACRCFLMHEFLVKEGLLKLLVSWLADPVRNELAPLQLREAALAILMMLPYEGIKDPDVGLPGSHRRNIDEDGDGGKKAKTASGCLSASSYTYEGVRVEDLQEAAHLGWAINFVRKHPQEGTRNRSTATRLMEIFSRVFRGGDHAPTGDRKLYTHEGNPLISGPFQPEQSVTMRFIARSSVPDPNDPDSYLRQRRPFSSSSIAGYNVVANATAIAHEADRVAPHVGGGSSAKRKRLGGGEATGVAATGAGKKKSSSATTNKSKKKQQEDEMSGDGSDYEADDFVVAG